MNAFDCCQQEGHASAGDKQSWRRRAREAAGWVIPGAVLALMPKCPICLAAYVALGTGFTMSYASAHWLMRGLIGLSLATLALCITRRVLKFHKQNSNL
jgi:hypothetical protein